MCFLLMLGAQAYYWNVLKGMLEIIRVLIQLKGDTVLEAVTMNL